MPQALCQGKAYRAYELHYLIYSSREFLEEDFTTILQRRKPEENDSEVTRHAFSPSPHSRIHDS